MHITIKHILKFDFDIPWDCSDETGWIRLKQFETDAAQSSKCRLECSSSIDFASSAWNYDSPLMELHLDSRDLEAFSTNSPKQLLYKVCGEWIQQELCKMMKNWWRIVEKSDEVLERMWEVFLWNSVMDLGICDCVFAILLQLRLYITS